MTVKVTSLIVGLMSFACAGAAELRDPYVSEQHWVSAAAPTVLVAHGCSGDLPHYHDWAREIAGWGFNAVVVDSYTARKLPNGTCGRGNVLPAERREEIYRIAAQVKALTQRPVGLIGFSHGGNLVLHVGVDNGNAHIDAAVAFYPNCSRWGRKFTSIFDTPRNDYRDPAIPVLLMYGTADSWTPYKECDEVVQGKHYERHLFNGATHGFDMKMDRRMFNGHVLEYNGPADEASRTLTRAFFERTLRRQD